MGKAGYSDRPVGEAVFFEAHKCARRAGQLGLRGALLEAYGKREILQIIDLSALVAEQRAHIHEWKTGKLMTPTEHVYLPAIPNVTRPRSLPQ